MLKTLAILLFILSFSTGIVFLLSDFKKPTKPTDIIILNETTPKKFNEAQKNVFKYAF